MSRAIIHWHYNGFSKACNWQKTNDSHRIANVFFEFINLLIHPSLAAYTHESPVLMLLALVIIASLLIPYIIGWKNG